MFSALHISFCLGSYIVVLLFRRILDIQSRRHYLFFMIQSFTENRAFSFSRLAVFKTPYPVVKYTGFSHNAIFGTVKKLH